LKKFIFYTLAVLLFTSPALTAKTKALKLKNQQISYVPVNFHIVAVNDVRPDTTSIGQTKIGIIGKVTTIDLEGGAGTAFLRYISNNMQQNTSTTPVTIYIKKLLVSEESAILAEKTNVEFALEFHSGDRKLMEYSGSSYTQTGYDATAYLSGMIRQFIETSIKEFDSWYTENKEMIEQ